MRGAFLYLLFINLVDYITTAFFVKQQGYDIETNPVLCWLMRTNDSHYAIFFYKIVVIALYAGSMYLLYRFQPDRYARPFWKWVVYLFNFTYTIVVLRSLYVIFML